MERNSLYVHVSYRKRFLTKAVSTNKTIYTTCKTFSPQVFIFMKILYPSAIRITFQSHTLLHKLPYH
jgi:hypothetical protein